MALGRVEEGMFRDENKNEYSLKVTLYMTEKEFDLMFLDAKKMVHAKLDGITELEKFSN